MPLINVEQLKPLSDVAQDAFKAWLEAGKVLAAARDRADAVGEERARRVADLKEQAYNLAARELATRDNTEIAIALS